MGDYEKTGIVESRQFGKYDVRIRRRGKGTVGQNDSLIGLPWILEQKEPSDIYRSMFGGFNTSDSAQWMRYSIWGGPRPI